MHLARGGWQATRVSLKAGPRTRPSSFGDPDFVGGSMFLVNRQSKSAAISSTDQSRPVTPDAIAGVTRSVWWMRTKL
jgi:hypothetical protein